MKKKVFESCPKYLGALTWNHPTRTCLLLYPSIRDATLTTKHFEMEILSDTNRS